MKAWGVWPSVTLPSKPAPSPHCCIRSRPCLHLFIVKRGRVSNLPRADPSDASSSSEPSKLEQQPSSEVQVPQGNAEGASPSSPVVEASNVLESNAATSLTQDTDILPLLPDSLVRKAIEGFTALCIAHVAVGVGLAAAAASTPSFFLPSSIAGSALGATMLGSVGVAFMRVGSLLWFLRHSASSGEMATWRHQRINAAVGVFAAMALISQLVALPASAPLLSGLVLVLCAGTLAFCGLQAQECWGHRPWLQWMIGPDLGDSVETGLSFLKRDLSSIAGFACLGMLAVSSLGLLGFAQNSSWAWRGIPHTCMDGLYAPGCSAAAVQGLNGLRRLCIVGFLPAAMVAHTLLELATHVRVFRAQDLVASELLGSLEQHSQIGRLLSPQPERFTTLFWLGLFAAGGLQAFLLLQAPSMGVNVNRDILLMAPLFWSCMLSGLFSVACIFVVDWINVQSVVGRLLHAIFSLVSGAIATFVIKHEWLIQHKL